MSFVYEVEVIALTPAAATKLERSKKSGERPNELTLVTVDADYSQSRL